MKKLLILFVSCILILVACTKSDLRVQGFVKTNKGAPIQDVSVSIQKSQKILDTTTDKTGYYVFYGMPAGTWEMTVSKEGYQTQTKVFSISGGSSGNSYTKNFELKKQ